MSEPSPFNGQTLLPQIVMEEIRGKNLAIHAYDKIIWIIRTGFATLFLAAWGIMLVEFVKPNVGADVFLRTAAPLSVVSIGFALCGWIVDINYVRWKFRVIAAIDAFYAGIASLNAGTPATNDAKLRTEPELIAGLLRISGDSGDKSYRIKGYGTAV